MRYTPDWSRSVCLAVTEQSPRGDLAGAFGKGAVTGGQRDEASVSESVR